MGAGMTVERLRRATLAESTQRCYASGWRRWEAFCATRNEAPLAASGQTAAEWYASLVDKRVPRWSMETWRSAVRRRYRDAGLADHCPLLTPIAREAWQGVLRVHPRIVRSSRALLPAELAAMLRACDDDLLPARGVRDAAILALGFAAALRCGEIAGLSVRDVELVADDRARLHIRRSKTDQQGLGQVVPVIDGRHIRPLTRLRKWLVERELKPGSLFLACPPWTGGAHAHGRVAWCRHGIRYNGIRDVFRRRVREAGIDPTRLTPHSLRAGFATAAAERGAPLDRIMRVTRHVRIESVLGYIRRADDFTSHAGEGVL